MIIKLKEFLNSKVLMTPEKAKRVRKVIIEAFKQKKEVVLDFSEIKTVTLSFLYYLFEDFKEEIFHNMLRIINPTKNLYEEIEYLKKNHKELALKFKKIEVITN